MAHDPFVQSLRQAAVTLPENQEEKAFEVLDQLETYERKLILPAGFNRPLVRADYAEGSATEDDQVAIFNSRPGAVILSADHATDPVRKATGIREGADQGTAGIVRLLSERNDTTAIVPLGRQTGNAATTPNHPVKQSMRRLLQDLNATGFGSIHGMMPGKIADEGDATEIQAIIGLGKEPSEKSRVVAKKLIVAAHDIGLRAVIGNDMRYMTRDAMTGELLLDDNGEPSTGKLAALGAESTTNFARGVLDAQGKDNPAMQIELTRGLRLVATDFEGGWYADRKAKAMGVYLGYLLCSNAVDLILDSASIS